MPSSFGDVVAALVVSAVAHTSAILVLGSGHLSAAPSVEPIALEIAAPSLELPPPESPNTQQSASVPPTHVHPYPVRPDHDQRPHDPSIVHPAIVLPAHAPPPTAPNVQAGPGKDETPRFTIVIGSSTNALAGSVQAVGQQTQATADVDSGPVLDAAHVDQLATVTARALPVYPALARKAGIEADVALEIIVEADGRVIIAHPLTRVGYGLEESAIASIRTTRFNPAQRMGQPVRVRMRWVAQFRLD